ncbi:MAG: (Na+)-NQR maturation NqrM [Moraxellaceae bacterium]
MLTTFAVSLAAVLLFIGLMAVGVMLGREPLKGSCGGLNKLGLRDGDCPVCGGNPAKCESNSPEPQNEKAAKLGRDVMKKP